MSKKTKIIIIAAAAAVVVAAVLLILLLGGKPVEYMVAFDSTGGSAVESLTVREGKPAAKPADPAKEGFTFAGWMLDGLDYDFAAPVAGDITLAAAWEAKMLTVTFDDGLGSADYTYSIEWGQTVEEIAAPSRSGYAFDGWYLGESAYDFAAPVTEDITLTAKWSVGGLSLNKSSAEIYRGSNYTIQATFTPASAATALTYKSSDTAVVTVDSKGVVTAVGKGSATVTVTTATGVSKTVNFTVTVKVESVSLSVNKQWLFSGKATNMNDQTVEGSCTLTYTVSPSDADFDPAKVEWTASSTSGYTTQIGFLNSSDDNTDNKMVFTARSADAMRSIGSFPNPYYTSEASVTINGVKSNTVKINVEVAKLSLKYITDNQSGNSTFALAAGSYSITYAQLNAFQSNLFEGNLPLASLNIDSNSDFAEGQSNFHLSDNTSWVEFGLDPNSSGTYWFRIASKGGQTMQYMVRPR